MYIPNTNRQKQTRRKKRSSRPDYRWGWHPMEGSQPQLRQVSVVCCALQAVQQCPSLPLEAGSSMTTQTLPVNHPWVPQPPFLKAKALDTRELFYHVSTAVRDLTLPDSVSQLQMGLQEGKSIYHRNEQLIHWHTTNPPLSQSSSLRALAFPPHPTELTSTCLRCLTPRLEHEVQKQRLLHVCFLHHQHIDSDHNSL